MPDINSRLVIVNFGATAWPDSLLFAERKCEQHIPVHLVTIPNSSHFLNMCVQRVSGLDHTDWTNNQQCTMRYQLVSGHEALFCWVLVPELTMAVSITTYLLTLQEKVAFHHTKSHGPCHLFTVSQGNCTVSCNTMYNLWCFIVAYNTQKLQFDTRYTMHICITQVIVSCSFSFSFFLKKTTFLLCNSSLTLINLLTICLHWLTP